MVRANTTISLTWSAEPRSVVVVWKHGVVLSASVVAVTRTCPILICCVGPVKCHDVPTILHGVTLNVSRNLYRDQSWGLLTGRG